MLKMSVELDKKIENKWVSQKILKHDLAIGCNKRIENYFKKQELSLYVRSNFVTLVLSSFDYK
jgi:hypothetical protein